jgi:hypothetical protein
LTSSNSRYFQIVTTLKSLKPKRRRKRIVGITADAAALSVTRFHLFKVLTGNRESPKLVARYRALKAAQAKANL